VFGRLASAEAESLDGHLLGCQVCVRALQRLLSEDPLVATVRSGATLHADGSLATPELERVLRKLKQDLPTARGQGHTPSPAASAPEAAQKLLPLLRPPQGPGEIGRLGGYRVLEVLGRGGMGVVFRAEDVGLRRQVALKVMKPEAADKPEARDRFLREARAAALEHENVVAIYQVGEEGGVPFLAMQWLKGMSLENLLCKAGSLKVPQVLRLGRQIAVGLAAAHEHGLIHRDIKPANLWLEPERGGRIRILDFGLARSLADEAHLTQSGTILGTPAYMAPEQAQGGKVDHRCDLFSLGVVLYHLCTGQLPFRGADTLAVLTALALEMPPAPRTVNAAVPEELSVLIMELLAKEPPQRPATAGAVAERLGQIEHRPPTPPAKQPRPRPPAAGRKRRVLAAVAVVVLILGLLAYCFGGVVLHFATNQGELVVEIHDPTVEVAVKQDNLLVHDKTSKREFVLAAKNGAIEVYEKDGVKLLTRQFELTRGGKTTITVTAKELADARKPDKPEPVVVAPGDRDGKAAEWVLSLGGRVIIEDNGTRREVNAAKDLPAGPWLLRGIGFDRKVTDAGLKELAGLKGLQSLELGFTQVTDIGLKELAGLQALRDLGLGGTKVTDAGLKELAGLKSLQQLDLFATQVTDAGLKELAGFQALQILGLGGTQVTDAGLKELTGLKSLQRLYLGGTKVSDAGLVDLVKMPNLTVLDLSGARVSTKGFATLKGAFPPEVQIPWSEPNRTAAEAVLALGGSVHVAARGQADDRLVKAAADLPADYFQVTHVNLAGCKQPPGDGVLAKLAALRDPQWDRLQTLDLSATALGDGELANLKDLSGLTELLLARTQVGDGGLRQLEALRGLRRLVLDGCPIRGNGLHHLSELPHLTELRLGCPMLVDVLVVRLAELKKLERLSLAGSGVTDEGLKHLTGLVALQELDLTGTKVTDAGITELKKALPNCRIHSGPAPK
jgi:serine/threonine protein kinase/Leucine-rich repeat (LRR) protein